MAMRIGQTRYVSTVGASDKQRNSGSFASSKLAPTVKMVNHPTAAIAHALCSPPVNAD
jgi:hypothetical protein